MITLSGFHCILATFFSFLRKPFLLVGKAEIRLNPQDLLNSFNVENSFLIFFKKLYFLRIFFLKLHFFLSFISFNRPFNLFLCRLRWETLNLRFFSENIFFSSNFVDWKILYSCGRPKSKFRPIPKPKPKPKTVRKPISKLISSVHYFTVLLVEIENREIRSQTWDLLRQIFKKLFNLNAIKPKQGTPITFVKKHWPTPLLLPPLLDFQSCASMHLIHVQDLLVAQMIGSFKSPFLKFKHFTMSHIKYRIDDGTTSRNYFFKSDLGLWKFNHINQMLIRCNFYFVIKYSVRRLMWSL